MIHPHQTIMLLYTEYNQTPIKLNDLTVTTRPEDITTVSREGEAEVELGSVELGWPAAARISTTGPVEL
jgi:hypothetical protein